VLYDAPIGSEPMPSDACGPAPGDDVLPAGGRVVGTAPVSDDVFDASLTITVAIFESPHDKTSQT
jgi:hypothetical protein